MAFFVLNSEITIGKFTWSGVNEVRIRRGIHGYADSAIIKIPRKCRVQNGTRQKDGSVKIQPGTAVEQFPGKIFNDHDPVTIRLGYNGDLKEEFRGFVKRRNMSMPMEIECEGYVQQLRLKTFKGDFKRINVKKLLELVCKGTDIKIQCPVDFQLRGINIPDWTLDKVLDKIKECSCDALTIFFIKPDVLWCGLVYTPYLAGSKIFDLPTVDYRLGWNVVKDNGLKERTPSEPVQVVLNGIVVTDGISNNDKAARKEKHLLNNVPDIETLKTFAKEKQFNANYTGYEGHINAFLQPYCLPGYSVNIVDNDYKERNGVYIAESTEVTFGVHGARRKIEIGPKLNGLKI